MRFTLLLLFLIITVNAKDKTLSIKDFKIDREKEVDGHYYTYSYSSSEKIRVFLALNSYSELNKAIKESPKAIILPKEDARVVQDLILDRKYSYLVQIPIFTYESLGNSINQLKDTRGKKELKKFQEFRKFIKGFSGYSIMFKSKDFWARIKKESQENELCINYKILLSAKEKTASKRYSFVTSFEKLIEYNRYFNNLFEYENGKFKDYKFKRFETYKEIDRKVKSLKAFRSRLDPKVQGMVKYVQANGELVMRFDAQWKRLDDIKVELDRRGRTDSRRIGQLQDKYASIVRLLNDMTPDIQKMSKGLDRHSTKYVAKLNQRNSP